ncbi:hypothetical protein GOBAR_AA25609 [Gossypium barbadense]|uniref:GH10 domain-containing protein n=1 Tax=Gossypium barbadense TaxID=3634 RepID=A0A2P5WVD8_GOSBA|nr:hypothetical protein GOBAR_AA25609 [Gossypium barbadense]
MNWTMRRWWLSRWILVTWRDIISNVLRVLLLSGLREAVLRRGSSVENPEVPSQLSHIGPDRDDPSPVPLHLVANGEGNKVGEMACRYLKDGGRADALERLGSSVAEAGTRALLDANAQQCVECFPLYYQSHCTGLDSGQPLDVLASSTDWLTLFGAITAWIKIQCANSALIRASLKTENRTYNCIGTVLAKNGCWSFLKGGFVLDSPSNLALLLFQNSDDRDIDITIDSSSLQPFTDQEWRFNQQFMINTSKEACCNNTCLRSTSTHHSWEFAVSAVFENELKWYATEPDQGKTNYTLADQMLEFVRAHQIIARGHNIFWEDPKYTPA